MTQDRPLLGITFVIGFCILAPVTDALAKLLGAHMPVAQLALIRFTAQVVLLLPLVLWVGGSLKAAPNLWPRIILRAVLHISGIVMIFTALQHMPLADAIAIAYVMPFILLLLGKIFLNEDVGRRRIIACVVGFGGCLLVIQPSFVDVGWIALLPLAVAVVFALYMLVTRTIVRDIEPIPLQVLSGGVACALLWPVLLLAQPLGAELTTLVPIKGEHLFQVALFAVLGTVAHLMVSWSLKFAPASTLAPVQYLEIPSAAVIGWLVFAQFPNGLALVGVGIVVGAGLYIVIREGQIHQASKQSPPPEVDHAAE